MGKEETVGKICQQREQVIVGSQQWPWLQYCNTDLQYHCCLWYHRSFTSFWIKVTLVHSSSEQLLMKQHTYITTHNVTWIGISMYFKEQTFPFMLFTQKMFTDSINYISVPKQQVHTVAWLYICSIHSHGSVPDLQGGLLETLECCEISTMHVEYDGIKLQIWRVNWQLGAKVHQTTEVHTPYCDYKIWLSFTIQPQPNHNSCKLQILWCLD